MNIKRSRQVVEELAHFGVKDFCLCAGARNAPFVKILAVAEGVQLHSFFDERSAAFFALGRSQSQERPVAVVTTSGTAVAELLPAVIEAHYTNTPLVLVTADRPAHFRHSGSPQSIQQIGIFSHYVDCTYDLTRDCKLEISHQISGPLHINVCFDEPLIDEKLPTRVSVCTKNYEVKASEPTVRELSTLTSFFQTVRSPLAILSGLTKSEAESLLPALTKLGGPVYAESTSQLKSHNALEMQLVRGGEIVFRDKNWVSQFDGVIRIGGIPACRFWRDLEETYDHLPVLNVSSVRYTGLPRITQLPTSLFSFKKYVEESKFIWNSKVEINSVQKLAQINEALSKYPLCEVAQLQKLSEMIEPGDQVFLGNSLPIREWDILLEDKKGVVFNANRGVNGIDGLVSTALGWGQSQKSLWCVLGDLSALYDLSALWALKYLESEKLRVVVVNNQGGKIFSRVFKDKEFENNHQIRFSGWAELFSVEYIGVSDISKLEGPLPDRVLIELCPDNFQSEGFWRFVDQDVN